MVPLIALNNHSSLSCDTPASLFNDFLNIPDAASLLESLIDGDFEAVLLSPQSLDLLKSDGSCCDGEKIDAYLEKQLLSYLTNGTEDDRANR